MSKVKVSNSRSWLGLSVTICAIFLLGIIILANRESVPPTPTSVAQIEPSSTPTNVPEQPTIEPIPHLQAAQFPDAYILLKETSVITVRDLETSKKRYTLGVADEFHYQAGHIILHRDHNVRIIEHATGQIRWEGALIGPFELLVGYVVRPEQNQFIVASYVNPINSQLRFTTYELDTNQLLDQATFEIETELTFVPGISSSNEIFMYSPTELIRYDLATKTQTKLTLPELEGRLITAVTKHPSQDIWYLVDDLVTLYQLNFVTNQPNLKNLTPPSEAQLYEFADIVATEKGLYFAARFYQRNIGLFHYNFVSSKLTERHTDQEFINLDPDFVAQGVWINSYLGEHTHYWDGQSATTRELPFESSKVISVNPVMPEQSQYSTELTPSSLLQQVQTNSEPFIWIKEYVYPDDQVNGYTYSTIQALAPDGRQTIIATDVIAAFERPNMAPLLLIEDQGYQLYDPAQQAYLSVKKPITTFVNRSYRTEQPYAPQSMYLVNREGNVIAWIGTNNQGVEQLVVTNLTTGVQTIHPFNLSGDFLRSEFVYLLGWHESMIYFMHDTTQIWQLNLESNVSTLLHATEIAIEEILYLSQSQQIAFASTDSLQQAYFGIYTIPQNTFEQVPDIKSISHLSLAPSSGLLSFIAHGEEEQATLMIQTQAAQLRFVPVYTFNYFDMMSSLRASTDLWIDAHTLQIYEYAAHTTDVIKQGLLTKITTIDLEADTVTQRFSTIDLVHQNQ